MKKRLHLHTPKPNLTLFHYTLKWADDKYVAQYVSELPAASIEENSSVLMIAGGEESQGGITGDMQFGIHITWLSGKPEPNTEKRNLGLMAVFNNAYLHLPLKVRKKLKKMQIALGHLPGAIAELK